MRILRKILFRILILILVLVVVAVVLVDIFAERAVKYGIETAGTKALSVGVYVDDVDLSLGGKLTLRGVSIKNPPGYQYDKLLELDTVQIEVDLKSLLSDVVRIKSIKLDGAVLVVEQKLTRSNLQEVAKAIPRGRKSEGRADDGGKKLHIDLLEITNTRVKVKLLPLPGRADTIPLRIGTIRKTNLGSDNQMSTVALTGLIISAIARGVAAEGVGILPDEIVSGLSTVLGKTADIGKGIIKGGADIGKKILEGAGDIGKGIGDGLKSLLPGKEKEE